MGKRFLILLVILSTSLTTEADGINDLRKSFHESVLRSDKLPEFLKRIEGIENPNAIERAYLGASHALMAREAWNPIEKLIHIRNFRNHLDLAIERDTANIEIRFLRLSIEYNIPELFRSNKSISEDKSIMLNELLNASSFELEKTMTLYILTFFKDIQFCSEEEIELIRRKLS